MMIRLALAAALVAAAPLAAQTDSARVQSLEPGSRVRVAVVGADGWSAGRLARVTADSLVLRPAEALPIRSIERLDVSAGRPRALWATGGAVAGVVVGILVTRADDPEGEDIGGLGTLANGIGNTIVGALTGAVIGYVVAPERWRPVLRR